MLPGSLEASVTRLRRKSNIRRTKKNIIKRLGAFVYRVDTARSIVRSEVGKTAAQKKTKCVAGALLHQISC